MQGIVVVWGLLLWAINMLAGLLIVQHAVCNLSRWQYTVRSMRRIYREYADDPKGLWAHAKAEVRRIWMQLRALFVKGGKQ